MADLSTHLEHTLGEFRRTGKIDTLASRPDLSSELAALAFRRSPSPHMITTERIIVDCNTPFLTLFGYQDKGLAGESVLKLYPSTADYYVIGERCRKWLSTHTFYEDERFMQHRSGEIFW